MILDLESDSPILDIKEIENSAESLYLLIHQRFVLSRQG
jgi:tRNA (Thr-GGU) A37 N-methylase